MVPLWQVSTKSQIRAEDYLHMTFEHDAEFVHGEIVERSMPDNFHSLLQYLILVRFGGLARSHLVQPRPELRLKVAPGIYRIPDVCVFLGEDLLAPVPDIPPLVVIEIISPDERHPNLMKKLEEYREFGVAHIWLVDPQTRKLSVYNELGLQNVSSLSLPEYSFQLTPEELFSQL